MELKTRPKIIDHLHRNGTAQGPVNEGICGGIRTFTIFFENRSYLAEGPLDGAVTRVLGRVLPKPAGPQHAAGEGQCLYRHGEYTYLLEKLESADAERIRGRWNSSHGH